MSAASRRTVDATRRRRVAAGVSIGVAVAVGLAVHRSGAGAAADIMGDALYTVAVYAVLVAVFPRMPAWRVASIAAGWSVAVELFQATGVPAAWADTVPATALVLGRGFDARDLAVYLAAAAVAWTLDATVARLQRTSSRK